MKAGVPVIASSFEDKVVRFAHKDSHQLFIEPEGRATDEMYVQGMNTSLPEDVQIQVLPQHPRIGESAHDPDRICHRV